MITWNRTCLLRIVLAAGFAAPSLPLFALDPCSGIQQSQGVSTGDVLKITSSTFSAADLSSATAYWSGVCTNFGSTFPSLRVNANSGIPVSVTFIDSISTIPSGACGQTTPTLVYPNNLLSAAHIKIWAKQSNGVICNKVDTLAHELGHLLGLKDAPSSANCMGRIMGQRPDGGTRSVSASDCAIADERWRTTPENSPGDRPPRCRDH